MTYPDPSVPSRKAFVLSMRSVTCADSPLPQGRSPTGMILIRLLGEGVIKVQVQPSAGQLQQAMHLNTQNPLLDWLKLYGVFTAG